MIDDALALEEAGVFAIVLECVPSPLGRLITESLRLLPPSASAPAPLRRDRCWW